MIAQEIVSYHLISQTKPQETPQE